MDWPRLNTWRVTVGKHRTPIAIRAFPTRSAAFRFVAQYLASGPQITVHEWKNGTWTLHKKFTQQPPDPSPGAAARRLAGR